MVGKLTGLPPAWTGRGTYPRVERLHALGVIGELELEEVGQECRAVVAVDPTVGRRRLKEECVSGVGGWVGGWAGPMRVLAEWKSRRERWYSRQHEEQRQHLAAQYHGDCVNGGWGRVHQR